MSKKNAPLKQDVEELLEKAVVEEATEAVWQVFEKALSKLDEQELELMRSHFNGLNAHALSKKQGVSEAEVQKMIKHSKKELVERIRRDKPTRQ